MTPHFTRLNHGWNAEPNAPEPTLRCEDAAVFLRFHVNPYVYRNFRKDDVGILRFVDCERYRMGGTNDEGWYKGQCRYSGIAPDWGWFYELTGDDPQRLGANDWILVQGKPGNRRHFLFYFRDETFECMAATWVVEPIAENALFREKVSVSAV